MSDFDFDDDFGRKPGLRMDPDEAMADMRAQALNTTDEQRNSDDDAMRAFMASEVGKAVTAVDSTSAHLVTDPEVYKHVQDSDESKTAYEAIDEATRQVHQASTQAAFDETPSRASNREAQGLSTDAMKPTSLESSLSSIKMTGDRQERFVISGDPKIEQRFYEKLAANGWVTYRGGVPMIGVSRDKALSMLKEAAAEVPGGQFHHALSVRLDREGDGAWTGLKAGIANALGRRHQVDVVVVGNQETVDAKMQELGSLVQKMDKAEFFGPAVTGQDGKAVATSESQKAVVDGNGRLVAPTDGPLRLDATKKLYDLAAMTRDVVIDYQAKENVAADARKEHRNSEDDKRIEKSKGDPGITSEASTDGASGASKVKANEFTREITKDLAKAIGNPDTLGAINEKGQVPAWALLSRARKIKDPAIQELATIPTAERQPAVVQLAALVAKVDSGEVTNKSGKTLSAKDVDRTAEGESSIRDKVDGFIAAEKARDPQFLEKAASLTKELVSSGVLTEKQAAAVTANLVNVKVATATTEASTVAPTAAPTPPSNAASSSTPAEASSVNPQSVATPTDSAPAAEPKAVSSELRDRLETLAKAGPAALTSDQAHGLVAELDAKRTKNLSSLDANPGDKPTQTLVRMEVLLQEIAGGRLGPELKAQAQDLQSALGKWNEQNMDRVVSEGGSPEKLKADSERLRVADLPSGANSDNSQQSKGSSSQSSEGLSNSTQQSSDGATRAPSSAGVNGTSAAGGQNNSQQSSGSVLQASEGAKSEQSKGSSSQAGEGLSNSTQQSSDGVSRTSSSAGVNGTSAAGGQNNSQQSSGSVLQASDGAKSGQSAVSSSQAGEGLSNSTQQSSDGASRTSSSAGVNGTSAAGSQNNSQQSKGSSSQSSEGLSNSTQRSSDGATRAPSSAGVNGTSAAGIQNNSQQSSGSVLQASAGAKSGQSVVSSSQTSEGSSSSTQQSSDGATRAPSSAGVNGTSADGVQANSQQAKGSSSQSGEVLPLPAQGGAESATQPSPAAKLETQLTSSQQSVAASAQDTAKAAQSAQRMGETEVAAGKLSSLMANPAGSFTNRDKSWNESNVVKAATEVTRLDPESVASMSPAARTKLAAYASFLADGANTGRLPGFTSEQGKQLASQVTEKATALVNTMKPGDGLTAVTQKELEKAERMTGAMEQRQQSAGSSMSAQAGNGNGPAMSSAKEHATANFAKDMVHAVYKQPEMSEANAKYMLKNASQVTSASLKSLDPQTRAQAVVAMGHLASEVRNGAMGDFSKLNSTVQKNVIAAQNNSVKLQAEMSQDPAMRVELSKAHIDLPGKTAEAAGQRAPSSSAGDSSNASSTASSGGAKSAAPDATEATRAAPKDAGRSMDR